jgi:DNA-binding transcriptional ArsR family regulator
MLCRMTDFDCIPALKALSKPVRLRIVRLLSKEHLSVNEVAARLKMPQYQVSRHLQILRKAGLLELHNEGKKHLHKVPAKQLAHQRNTLELGCCAFRFDKLSG